MDAEGNKFPKGEVAINGREIVAVGAENEIAPKFRPMRVSTRVVRLCTQGILTFIIIPPA